MKKLQISLLIIVCAAAPIVFSVCCSGGPGAAKGPCDIYAREGTPCVTAHSTVRRLYSAYDGPLYQVRRESDGKSMDIGFGPEGYAQADVQDEFCKGTLCYITMIYDQSGKGNDLVQAAPGTFRGPDKGGFNTLPIADMAPVLVNGHKAYGVYVIPGMGFRCNNARGLAIDDEPEGIYYVVDGRHYDSGCCFDYGNSSTNGKAVGTGTMETTYYGTSTNWGSGDGTGPWIMADMEGGLFSGYNAKKNPVPTIDSWEFVSVFVNGGGGNQWDLRGGDATKDSLTTYYSGVRPGSNENDSYYPMHKKGGMLLGNGGDNGNGSSGTFYEGVMTVGYPTDATVNKVQKNIASVHYETYPISMTRIKTFTPGSSHTVRVAVSKPSGINPDTHVVLGTIATGGWIFECTSESETLLTYTLTAPNKPSSGYVEFTLMLADKSYILRERLRSVPAIKVNELLLSNNGQFIELYNASDTDVDISGYKVEIRRSGEAPVTAAVMPAGTVVGGHGFLVLTLAQNAVTAPAAKGSSSLYLSADADKGTVMAIGNTDYRITGKGVPAGPATSIFAPVSTGPRLTVKAGSTNIPATSVQGFSVGQAMGIDLGGNYEIVTVTEVGTAATQSNLAAAAAIGDTQLEIDATASLQPGSLLIVDTGDRMETVTVKEILRYASAPAARRFGPGAQPHQPGLISIEKPLAKAHATGVDVSCTGSGITFTPATRFDHLSGDALQPLGTPYAVDKPLAADVFAWQAAAALSPKPNIGISYGYAASASAGSVALIEPVSGAVVDAIVYGSQQSNSSADGTVASPDIATLEGEQGDGGCIAVAPRQGGFRFGAAAPAATSSLIRYPDGKDDDQLCKDWSITTAPTPGSPNK